MTRAGSHVSPPSVVRENTAGPRVPVSPRRRLTSARRDCVPGGDISRVHTTYPRRASVGSTVIVSLSVTNRGSKPSTVTGALHVRPPSVDLLTRMTPENPGKPGLSNARLLRYRSPLGAKLSHGSLTRCSAPPEHSERLGLTPLIHESP